MATLVSCSDQKKTTDVIKFIIERDSLGKVAIYTPEVIPEGPMGNIMPYGSYQKPKFEFDGFEFKGTIQLFDVLREVTPYDYVFLEADKAHLIKIARDDVNLRWAGNKKIKFVSYGPIYRMINQWDDEIGYHGYRGWYCGIGICKDAWFITQKNETDSTIKKYGLFLGSKEIFPCEYKNINFIDPKKIEVTTENGIKSVFSVDSSFVLYPAVK